MSTQRIRPDGAAAVAGILLFPLRAVEQARGWRRFVLLLAYAMIALPIVAVGWRRSQLAGLPDVGNTFEVPAPRPGGPVPDDRNSFVLYRQAAGRFRDLSGDKDDSFKANFRWAWADANIRRWVTDNREAVSLLRAGSERPEACLEQPGKPTDLLDPDGGAIVSRLLAICQVALFEAGRLRTEGDPAGAWASLKAVVRASRDIERAAPRCLTLATFLVQEAHDPVADWTKDPSVDVALLRHALDNLAAVEALTPPLSHFYRREYRAVDESLKYPEPLIAERAKHLADVGIVDLSSFAAGLDAFLRGEPDRSRRVLRLLAANDLAWCDRPGFERPPLAVPGLHIYQVDPSTPPAARALSPEDLARWSEWLLFHPAPSWRTGELEAWDQNDRRSLSQLKENLAVALFTRETGHAPASSAEALRHYLPIPGDTPERSRAAHRTAGRAAEAVTTLTIQTGNHRDAEAPRDRPLVPGGTYQHDLCC